jgi:hypothetical protein
MNLIKLAVDYANDKPIPKDIKVIPISHFTKVYQYRVKEGDFVWIVCINLEVILVDKTTSILAGYDKEHKVLVIGPQKQFNATDGLKSWDIESARDRRPKNREIDYK